MSEMHLNLNRMLHCQQTLVGNNPHTSNCTWGTNHGWSRGGLEETLIHRIGVFWIFRFQSIWVGISGDDPSFRIYKRKKRHVLLRLANVVSPFLSTCGLSLSLSNCLRDIHISIYISRIQHHSVWLQQTSVDNDPHIGWRRLLGSLKL